MPRILILIGTTSNSTYMSNQVKSGKEILDDFFREIQNIPNVNEDVAKSLANLYEQGKLTDINVKNELQKIRDHVNKD